MGSTKKPTTDTIWSSVWKEGWAPARVVFANRLFVEGYQVFKKYLPPTPYRLLEVGAGTGRYGIAIARDNPLCEVVLSDPLEESLAIMKPLAEEVGVKNVLLIKEDALSFSFPDDSFDVVLADAVIQHIPNHEEALREMYRVTRPGGIIIISSVNTLNPPHRLYKWVLERRGKEYEYGYERTFSPHELSRALEATTATIIAQDGFFLAYGLMRWKFSWAKLVGRITNRVVKAMDVLARRAITRRYGFEIVCVGRK